MTGMGWGLTGFPVFMSMTELVRGTDLSIFLRGIGVSFLLPADIPVCAGSRSAERIDAGVIFLYSGIRFILLYNIKIHVHIKITIYKHNNT